MKGRFQDKVAIITGAGQGIGKQVALDMAAEGARVVICDVQQEALDDVKREIQAAGGACLAVACDVSSRAQIDQAVRQARDAFGRLDILVNNAGILLTGSIEDTTDEAIERTLDVNLKGVLYAIRAVTPIMRAQRYGRILNVASITGKNGDNTSMFVYGASKGAVITLTRSVARQLGPFGITCNAVAPHAVMTGLMSYWDEEKKRRMADTIPVRRLATPRDVSRLLLFLASDESSFITGETVNINGGYYMD